MSSFLSILFAYLFVFLFIYLFIIEIESHCVALLAENDLCRPHKPQRFACSSLPSAGLKHGSPCMLLCLPPTQSMVERIWVSILTFAWQELSRLSSSPSAHSPFLLSALFHPSYFTQHDWQPEPCFCLCSLRFEAPVSPTVIKTTRVP